MTKKTLLVVGAHMDDCEYAAGGTMLKAIAQGHRVVMVNTVGDFSNRTEIGRRAAAQQRKKVVALAEEMGAEKIFLDYKYQQAHYNLESCRKMARVVAKVRPDVVLLAHQLDDWYLPDHASTGRMALDAAHFTSQLLDGADVAAVREVYFACSPFRARAQASAVPPLEPDVFVEVTPHVEEICRLRFELDRIMTPGLPEEAYFALFVEPVSRATHKPERRIKLTAHAEQQFFAMRFWGAMAGVRYAEAFRACTARTKLPPRDFWL